MEVGTSEKFHKVIDRNQLGLLGDARPGGEQVQVDSGHFMCKRYPIFQNSKNTGTRAEISQPLLEAPACCRFHKAPAGP